VRVLAQYPGQFLIIRSKIELLSNSGQIGVFSVYAGSWTIAYLGIGPEIPIFGELEVTIFNLGHQHLLQSFILEIDTLLLTLAGHCLHAAALRLPRKLLLLL
jgi:hypothetical protein